MSRVDIRRMPGALQLHARLHMRSRSAAANYHEKLAQRRVRPAAESACMPSTRNRRAARVRVRRSQRAVYSQQTAELAAYPLAARHGYHSVEPVAAAKSVQAGDGGVSADGGKPADGGAVSSGGWLAGETAGIVLYAASAALLACTHLGVKLSAKEGLEVPLVLLVRVGFGSLAALTVGLRNPGALIAPDTV